MTVRSAKTNPPPYDDDLWHGEILYTKKVYNDSYHWTWRAVRVYRVNGTTGYYEPESDFWRTEEHRPYGAGNPLKIWAKFRAKMLARKLNTQRAKATKHKESEWTKA